MRAAQGSPHDCCKPVRPGHCGQHNSQKPCPGHDTTFESPGKVEVPGLAGVTLLGVEAEMLAPVALSLLPASAPPTPGLQHPPPERLLLNSILLI